MAENTDMVVEVVERKQQFLVMALFAFCIVLPIVGGYNSTENKTWWTMLPVFIIIISFLVVGFFDKFRSSNS